jgi:hypothetical protein
MMRREEMKLRLFYKGHTKQPQQENKQGGSKQGRNKEGGTKQGGTKQGGTKQGDSKEGGSKQPNRDPKVLLKLQQKTEDGVRMQPKNLLRLLRSIMLIWGMLHFDQRIGRGSERKLLCPIHQRHFERQNMSRINGKNFASNITRRKSYTMSPETLRVQVGYGMVLWMPCLVKRQKLIESQVPLTKGPR